MFNLSKFKSLENRTRIRGANANDCLSIRKSGYMFINTHILRSSAIDPAEVNYVNYLVSDEEDENGIVALVFSDRKTEKANYNVNKSTLKTPRDNEEKITGIYFNIKCLLKHFNVDVSTRKSGETLEFAFIAEPAHKAIFFNILKSKN